MSWTAVGGVLLPASRLHGPRIASDGRAAGYSRSEAGAALAAVQVLMRTSPTAGPLIYRPILAGQLTGANTAALRQTLDAQYAALREQAEATGGVRLPDGAPIPGANARIRGYRLQAFGETTGTALVEVVLDSPDLRLTDQTVSFTVSLRWAHDDWRVLAPPRGDWASTATPLGSVPEGLLSYDDLGATLSEIVTGTTAFGRRATSLPAGRERGAAGTADRQGEVSSHAH
ncbi:MAG: hypothetical protein GXX79_12165 [Actinomycetales bacterium]|nr:hypothetical protein [Actinomycetales bacterium]